MEHVVGAREAAAHLTRARVQAFHQYRRRHPGFPAAVYWTTQGPGGTGVWYWPDGWRWARASGLPEFVQLGPLRCCPDAPPGGTRRIDIDDLVGKESAERLRIRSIQRVHVMREEGSTFPAPVFSRTAGR